MSAWLHRSPEPLWQQLLLAPLLPAALLFGAAAAGRRALFAHGILPIAKAGVPVLSIGNLVAGGAGKTPVVIESARRLTSQGVRLAILSRGYGRTGSTPLVVSRGDGPLVDARIGGDEPVLLAARCPGACVLVGPSRIAIARRAVEELGAQLLLLDDGFQHLGLARELDVVVIDGGSPLGNGHLLPRGPLREGPRALRRAGLVWIAKADEASPDELARLDALALEQTGVPAVHARYRVAALRHAGQALPPEALSGRRVALLCGIARPGSFRRTLTSAGATIVHEARFPDHHAFAAHELCAALDHAAARGASLTVCTEKDAVRLPQAVREDPRLAVLQIDSEVLRGADELDRRLLALASAPRGRDG